MKTLTETTPRIFLTDYASYNNGTQFEFGHWVDLTDFNDQDELNDYIKDHFTAADKKSPLDEFGSIREEIMITDYEGFPDALYSECMHFEDLYKYLNLEDDERIKTAFILEQTHGDINYALDHFENVTLFEYNGTNAEKYDLFEMYYPGAYELENDYMTIDEDKFIKNEFTEFEHEGQDYLVCDSWNY